MTYSPKAQEAWHLCGPDFSGSACRNSRRYHPWNKVYELRRVTYWSGCLNPRDRFLFYDWSITWIRLGDFLIRIISGKIGSLCVSERKLGGLTGHVFGSPFIPALPKFVLLSDFVRCFARVHSSIFWFTSVLRVCFIYCLLNVFYIYLSYSLRFISLGTWRRFDRHQTRWELCRPNQSCHFQSSSSAILPITNISYLLTWIIL